MKNNAGQIPSIIFDWIGKYDFSALNAAQQQEVLQYFSGEEYQDLHQAATGIKAFGRSESTSGREWKKQQLLEKFDAHYTRSTPAFSLFRKPVALWKAAAVFVLFGSAWLCYEFLFQAGNISTSLVSTIDTVYITKEVATAPVRIYDTVYIDRNTKRTTKTRRYERSQSVNAENTVVPVSGIGTINIISIKELENVPNSSKKNSMKDDSLRHKYNFVTL